MPQVTSPTAAPTRLVVDGNEAAARVAYAASELIALYPITPASPMGEWCEQRAKDHRPNLWGDVPAVVEMQSEAGAAGVVHGALQTGALATTFTASQGLLLMIPNLYKIAGELSPAVIHVAARTVATHALSIFGDHSDVMAARATGWGMLCSASVQEAHDFAAIAHSVTLRTRLPFLHFFDGFRTSHELSSIEVLSDDFLRRTMPEDAVRAHRSRALDPDHPVLRGTAQNPDVYFQAREAVDSVLARVPAEVQAAMHELEKETGRRYSLYEYHGAPDAESVIVLMGSAQGAAREAVDRLVRRGVKVGVLSVRLFRPLSAERLVAALPETTRTVAVLDRTKEPGSEGEPLYLDLVSALARAWPREQGDPPRVFGGRYGLSSKEFTPAMAAAVFSECEAEDPRHSFTVGIVDDVRGSSLPFDPTFDREADDVTTALFYGRGSDGTVGSVKNTAKILAGSTGRHVQAYSVYDSKKSGSVTVSHLRVADRPIASSYCLQNAHFVAVHQFALLDRVDFTHVAPRARLLLNSPFSPEDLWKHVPRSVQEAMVELELELFSVDAGALARDHGLGPRINTILQACAFELSGLLDPKEAIPKLKDAAAKSYASRGSEVVENNLRAIDAATALLRPVPLPTQIGGPVPVSHVPADAPEFVRKVTAPLMAGKGDQLPVSALPIDGTFPVGTARYEKRDIAEQVPHWDAPSCIQCNLCVLVCPHAAIRSRVYSPEAAPDFAEHSPTLEFRGKEVHHEGDLRYVIGLSPEDCTGCGICVDVCPARSKSDPERRALALVGDTEYRHAESERFERFLALPRTDRSAIDVETVKGSQLLDPLFEYSGACAGCGETPYLKLLSQLYGDRAVIANATGCSSIFGGNLPTTPWTKDAEGRGPAWANSLFEDNAEFGLGMRLAIDRRRESARTMLREHAAVLGPGRVQELLDCAESNETEIAEQRQRVVTLRSDLAGILEPWARRLESLAEALQRRSVWIVGGDGWAYDIGFGGLDHVLASGADVNVLVLDTEVYSNTGGQMSKSTPRGAVARFAAGGKATAKKDLALFAMSYGNVYVAQVALGAQPKQVVKAFAEAESWHGPSLILAYSTCIAHGIDMRTSMHHQRDATRTGYWPLLRYDPRKADEHHSGLQLDGGEPSAPLETFVGVERRFCALADTDPDRSHQLLDQTEHDIQERYARYQRIVKQVEGGGGAG